MRGQGVVFWLLVGLGLIGLAPSVLLPEWRQYQALSVAAEIEEQKLKEFENQLERERRSLEALQNDPAVTARLARRELNYYRADERAISMPFTGPEHSNGGWLGTGQLGFGGEIAERNLRTSVRPPQLTGALSSAASKLPRLDYDRVFCDDPTRTMVMIMSTGLIAIAFGLFGRVKLRV